MSPQVSVPGVLLAASLLHLSAGVAAAASAPIYDLSRSTPSNVGDKLLESFITYSIEFSSWPDFAGNKSSPNKFSDALINNIGTLSGGHKPYLRIGGNTQDFAIYDANQKEALRGTYNENESHDYPTTITIGPSYFESYQTFQGVKYSHGFNMAKAFQADGRNTLINTVPLACKALSPDANGQSRLYTWEFGNEPDLFQSTTHKPRPSSWTSQDYANEFLNGSRTIVDLVKKHCPDLVQKDPNALKFMAPSMAGTSGNRKVQATDAWKGGMNTDNVVSYFSTHNYIAGADSPGVTLQGTLMNHSRVAYHVYDHINEYKKLKQITSTPPPLIFGETNSLYAQGRPGLSNVFGAALWGIDFALFSATLGFRRIHYHQGTNYRYGSWQPVSTDKTSIGTKAPYYATLAIAASVGNTQDHEVRVARLTPNSNGRQQTDTDSVYAIYSDNALVRVVVLNMRGHNTTVGGMSLVPDPNAGPRDSLQYTFNVPPRTIGRFQIPVLSVPVQRLMANGSDAITGITWDGYSYNYELNKGQKVRQNNVTNGERLQVRNNQVTVTVPDSSFAVLNF